MKYIRFSIITVLFFMLFSVTNIYAQNEQGQSVEKMNLYVQETCGYCEEVKKFINEKNLAENFNIIDIQADPENAAKFNDAAEKAGIPINDRGVPLLEDGDNVINSADQVLSYIGEKLNVSTEGYLEQEDPEEQQEEAKSVSVVLTILGVGILISVGVIMLTKDK